MATASVTKLIDTAHVIDSKGTHQHSIIWLHGFGDSSDGYKDLFTAIQPANTRIVLPNAPKSWHTFNGRRYEMRSWYDKDESDNAEVATQKGLLVIGSIKELIEEELKLVKDASHIIIGGFSQGGCLALLTGLTYTKQQLGGVICCSGRLMLEHKIPELLSEYARKVPILILHGRQDDRITWDQAKPGYELLKKNGLKDNMEVVVEDELGHSISQRGLTLIVIFCIKQLNL